MATDLADSLRLFAAAREGDRLAVRRLVDRFEDRLWRIVRIRVRAGGRAPVDVEWIRRAARSIDLGDLGGREPSSVPELLQILAVRIQRVLEGKGTPYERGEAMRADVPMVPRVMPEGAEHVVPRTTRDAGLGIERLWAERMRQLLDQEVRGLPSEWREVVLLRDYCCNDWASIVARLELQSAEVARALHAKAWKELKARLRPRLLELL